MQTIKLRELIESKGLKLEYVGKKLFPTNRYPYLALRRVLDGLALLDSTQISILSQITETPIQDIFEGATWKGTQTGSTITLASGNYTAELNTETWLTKVYENGTLFHEVLIANEGVSLSKYLKFLSNIIENKNNK